MITKDLTAAAVEVAEHEAVKFHGFFAEYSAARRCTNKIDILQPAVSRGGLELISLVASCLDLE